MYSFPLEQSFLLNHRNSFFETRYDNPLITNVYYIKGLRLQERTQAFHKQVELRSGSHRQGNIAEIFGGHWGLMYNIVLLVYRTESNSGGCSSWGGAVCLLFKGNWKCNPCSFCLLFLSWLQCSPGHAHIFFPLADEWRARGPSI